MLLNPYPNPNPSASSNILQVSFSFYSFREWTCSATAGLAEVLQCFLVVSGPVFPLKPEFFSLRFYFKALKKKSCSFREICLWCERLLKLKLIGPRSHQNWFLQMHKYLCSSFLHRNCFLNAPQGGSGWKRWCHRCEPHPLPCNLIFSGVGPKREND